MPIYSLTNQTNREVRQAIQTLKKLPKEFKGKKLKRVYRKAAKPLVHQAKRNVSDAQRPVKRYDKNGNHVATYYPGNLRRSIGILRLRLKRAIYVGPRVSRSGTKGEFKGGRYDPWYAHIVEHGSVRQRGQHFMKRAYIATKETVVRRIVDGTKTIIRDWSNRNSVR